MEQTSNGWRAGLTYAHALELTRPMVARDLDALEALVAFPTGDRFCAWTDWLDEATEYGLITWAERSAIRAAVGPQI